MIILSVLTTLAISSANGKSLDTVTKAASPYTNCGCQCSSLTFLDSSSSVQGNCNTVDGTGAQWCYVDSSLSSCQDLVPSSRFPHNPWSYEACATPPIGSSACPSHTPPSYSPPSYSPPSYSPPAYSPPAYSPPAYSPPASHPPPASPNAITPPPQPQPAAPSPSPPIAPPPPPSVSTPSLVEILAGENFPLDSQPSSQPLPNMPGVDMSGLGDARKFGAKTKGAPSK